VTESIWLGEVVRRTENCFKHVIHLTVFSGYVTYRNGLSLSSGDWMLTSHCEPLGVGDFI
jgi:hypothetical protein